LTPVVVSAVICVVVSDGTATVASSFRLVVVKLIDLASSSSAIQLRRRQRRDLGVGEAVELRAGTAPGSASS